MKYRIYYFYGYYIFIQEINNDFGFFYTSYPTVPMKHKLPSYRKIVESSTGYSYHIKSVNEKYLILYDILDISKEFGYRILKIVEK